MAPLDAAIALARFRRCVLVGKNLEFDMPRGADVFFRDRHRRWKTPAGFLLAPGLTTQADRRLH